MEVLRPRWKLAYLFTLLAVSVVAKALGLTILAAVVLLGVAAFVGVDGWGTIREMRRNGRPPTRLMVVTAVLPFVSIGPTPRVEECFSFSMGDGSETTIGTGQPSNGWIITLIEFPDDPEGPVATGEEPLP